ncbi:MAG: ferrous iron transport protein A [Thermoprotei archaeon]|nr:MAG: ferrous iron transport protein A [Thermoprotei archaeon]RLF25526.1 MAG: ferrous iron transport protein A [Thermoprotei archaeon]
MTDPIKLSEAEVGKAYEVIKVEGPALIRRRIMDMGIIPGAKIKVLRLAPLLDPIEILVRGVPLSIRRAEAQYIIVRETS